MRQIGRLAAGAARRAAAPACDEGPGKWALFDLAVRARDAYGLKPKQLDVLRALLTFLPGQRPDGAATVVFPSNRTLCERLNGTSEATVRRHVARLIEAGLIARRDSPNRKRYRVGRSPKLSFGFDLAPFFEAAAEMAARARRMAEEAMRRRELAAEIRLALPDLSTDRAADTARMLRRKLTLEQLGTLLASVRPDAEPRETPVSDDRIERHKETDTDPNNGMLRMIARIEDASGVIVQDNRSLEAATTMAARAAGIPEPVHRKVRERSGLAWTAAATAYVIERSERIADPSHYLLDLAERAETGALDIMGHALGRRRLTAVNFAEPA